MGIMIEGVSLHTLRQIKVQKGDLWHMFKSSDDGFVGFGEVYLTQIEHHEVKGWKRHNRYTLNIVVIMGSIKFVVYDDRENSSTKGEFQEVILSPKNNYQRLTVGPGLWIAFVGMEEKTNALIDLIPEVHEPAESDKKEINEIEFNFGV